MAKIFETSFETGSYRNKADNTFGVNTAGSFKRTEKGLSWYNDGTADITLPSTYTISRNSGTIEVWFKAFELIDERFLVAFDENNFSYLGFKTGNLKLESDTNLVDWLVYAYANLTKNVWYQLIIIANSGTINSYLNNILIDTRTPTADITFQYIGNNAGKARDWFGHIAKVIFDDEPYTAQQRSDAYERFLKASPRGIELYPRYGWHTKPKRLREDGLVAAYNMVPQGTVLTDISGNHCTGTLNNGVLPTFDGIALDGVDDFVALNISLALAATVKTICFRIKLATTTEMIHEGQAGALLILANGGSLEYAEYDNAFINGKDSDTIYAGQWMNIIVTSSTPVDNNTANLGYNSSTFDYGKFEIADLRYFNREFTLQDAKDYHNYFASRPVLVEPFKFDPVGSTHPMGWIKGTGTYVIDELTAQDPVLPELKIGTKILKCTGSGTIAIPSWWAYGTPEFYVKKGADANYISMFFISDRAEITGLIGYRFIFNSNEAFALNEQQPGNNQLFVTDNSYASINTWYGISPPRTKDGEFTSRVKGGSFGNTYQLITPKAVGGGTNPVTDNTYTTSKFIVLDFDVGDCIILGEPPKGEFWKQGVIQ